MHRLTRHLTWFYLLNDAGGKSRMKISSSQNFGFFFCCKLEAALLLLMAELLNIIKNKCLFYLFKIKRPSRAHDLTPSEMEVKTQDENPQHDLDDGLGDFKPPQNLHT